MILERFKFRSKEEKVSKNSSPVEMEVLDKQQNNTLQQRVEEISEMQDMIRRGSARRKFSRTSEEKTRLDIIDKDGKSIFWTDSRREIEELVKSTE